MDISYLGVFTNWTPTQSHAPPIWMALLSLSFSLTTSTPIRKTSLLVSSPNPTSTTSSTWTTSLNTHALLPPFRRARALNLTRGGSRSLVVCMAPEEERMTRRSPLDFPIVSAWILFVLNHSLILVVNLHFSVNLMVFCG